MDTLLQVNFTCRREGMDVLTEHGGRTSHRAQGGGELLSQIWKLALNSWLGPAVSREQGGGAECALASCYFCF